jgi:large subunit ribosomal protein L21
MFAIVEISGQQFKVSKGDLIKVPSLKNSKEGDKLKVDKVVLKSEGDKVEAGTPYISGSHVEILVKGHGKFDKIRVFKKKPKKRFENTTGQRPRYTLVEVTAIK